MVAGLAEDMSHRDFFGPHRPTWCEGSHANRMPACQKAGPCGRTTRMCRIKPIKTQPLGRHFIQHRRFHMRMPIVARFFPTMIVAHQQYDVRRSLSKGGHAAKHSERKQREDFFHVRLFHFNRSVQLFFDFGQRVHHLRPCASQFGNGGFAQFNHGSLMFYILSQVG